MRSIYQQFLRIALWPSLVILALNVEGIAKLFGIDNVLAKNASLGQRLMKTLLDFAQTQPVIYVAVFLAGGAAFAWISILIRQFERWGSRPNISWAAGNCAAVAKCLYGYNVSKWLGSIPKLIVRTNRQLTALELPIAPVHDLNDENERRMLAGYFGAIASFLERRDLAGAKLVAGAMHENLFIQPLDVFHGDLGQSEGRQSGQEENG